MPPMNVARDGDNVIVELDYPGVDKKDLSVVFDKASQTVTVKGHRRETKRDEQKHSYSSSYGTFERAFRVPEGLKEEDVQAQYENGVLKITFPKTTPEEAAKVNSLRSIEIQ